MSTRWPPKYVTKCRGWWVYRPWNREAKRCDPQRQIAKIGTPMSECWKIYEEMTGIAVKYNLKWLIKEYMKSHSFDNLKPNTQKDYRYYRTYLSRDKTTKYNYFDCIPLEKFNPVMLQRWHDSKSDIKTTANHLIRFIKMLFNWGRARFELIKGNPAQGVKLFKIDSPARYVEDWEYDLIYEFAKSPWYVQPMMELAYLCCLRSCEVVALKRSDIKRDGILCRRTKNSRPTLVRWSDRLEKAVKQARNKNAKIVSTEFLFYDNEGQPIRLSTLQSSWQRLKRKAQKLDYPWFRFHDLKHKGVSDNLDDKASGHRDPKMKDLYSHKIDSVEPTK